MDEHRESLAEQAAAWVPPWVREDSEPATGSEGVAEPVEPATEAMAAPEPEDFAEQPARGVSEPVEPATEGVAEPVESASAGDAEARADDGGAETVEGQSSTEPGDAVPVPPPQTAPPTALALIDEAELRAALEAILLVVDEPVGEVALAQILEQPTERVSHALADLAADYTAGGRGFDLRRAAGGWRLYTRGEYAAYVERFVLDGQQVRLTQAALETLAVVAYKQPVTRSRISAIRGVNCDGVIRTLVNRGLIEECGSEPESGAYLYRTTILFLEKLGLDSVAELPSLAPFLPDDVEEIADGQR